MAELFLKIGSVNPLNPKTYQDGDIIMAANDRRIKTCHAERICHPWLEPVDVDGLRSNSSLSFFYSNTVRQFRIQRIGRNAIRQFNLFESTQRDLAFPAEAFVAEMKKKVTDTGSPRFPLYGTNGLEVWFDGNFDTSAAKIGLVWDNIEAVTGLLESNHTLWPATTQELKSYLVIPVNDFDDATSITLSGEEVDSVNPDAPITRRRRKNFVSILSLLPIDGTITTELQARDQTVVKEVRLRPLGPYNRALIVTARPDIIP